MFFEAISWLFSHLNLVRVHTVFQPTNYPAITISLLFIFYFIVFIYFRSVVSRLVEGQAVIAETFSSVTIYFRKQAHNLTILSAVLRIRIRSDPSLFGRIRIRSNCSDPVLDPTKKCNKTRNNSNKLNRYFWKNIHF